MRIFVYKILIIILSMFFLYQLTIGYTIYSLQKKIFSVDKETVGNIKNKLRDEMNKAISKERIINREDSILIKKFIDKINKDLNNINQ